MSDDTGTHKQGHRRAIRRLTLRTIPLPVSASMSPPGMSPPGVSLPGMTESAGRIEEPEAVVSAAFDGLGAAVASSLSELRLPDERSESVMAEADSGDDAANDTASEKHERASNEAGARDTPIELGTSNAPPLFEDTTDPSSPEVSEYPPAERSSPEMAADEISDEEPETNPKLSFDELKRARGASEPERQASLPPPLGSDRPKRGPRRLDTPPPQAAGEAARVPELATPASERVAMSEYAATASTAQAVTESGRDDPDLGAVDEPTATSTGDGLATEEATGRVLRLENVEALRVAPVSDPSNAASSSVQQASAETGPASEEEGDGTAARLSRLDSDVPTRPRIELSHEMALAAGRVTSLEVNPVSPDDARHRRGSKLPPSGEPRVISSLTGRRSYIPVSADEDDEASRPSVIVTRAKIISDRPPKPSQGERPSKADRSERPTRPDRSDRPMRLERSDRPARSETSDRPAKQDEPEASQFDRTELAAREIASVRAELAARDLGDGGVELAAVPPGPAVSLRPSRRPGSADGDDFETLDIEDGEVEPPGTQDSDAGLAGDLVTSKAPPPPPQVKRAVVPTVQLAPAQPKAAPPPPPRAAASPLTAATLSTVAAVAAVPASAQAPVQPVALASAAAGGPSGAGPAAAASASKKSASQKQPRRRQWWETLFSDDYLRTVVRPTAAQIARQVDFMQASLGVAKGAAVLDVGCGLGQHALEFARRGSLVVALDLALPMITRAAEDAQQEGLRINFLHKDIRDIGFEGTFDAVVCVGTTFGFFDDEQNREVLGRLATALKPGGRLLLEVINRDHVLLSQPNLQWFEGDGCVVMEESDFNYYSSRLSVKRTMMREDGRQTESEYSIRLYALHELGQMMQQVGFRVKEVSGQQATRGVFFGAQSNRIILLAERKTGTVARSNGHSDAPAPADG